MNLSEWLEHIQRVHPKDWDLGLDRVGEVGRRLGVLHPAKTCFLVAGTNGKGSTCEYLSELALLSGRSYGKATSPFFQRYNEQIIINGLEASDEDIILAFTAVRDAAAEISLSYFEYGALAAMWLFQQAAVDVAILEIGLGGRLDAMNIIAPDVSIITRIALDHQDWLGDDREAIGYEKAGVMRSGKPVVVLDQNPPQSLLSHADEIGAQLALIERDFHFENEQLTLASQSYRVNQAQLPVPSALAAIVGCRLANFEIDQAMIDEALQRALLPGRFQVLRTAPLTIVDVCHNPDAAEYLVRRLSSLSSHKWHLVVGIYSDKDISAIFQHLTPIAASWHFSALSVPRGARAEDLQTVLSDSYGLPSKIYDKVSSAFEAASQVASSDEGVLVLGSFTTVAAVLSYWEGQT